MNIARKAFQRLPPEARQRVARLVPFSNTSKYFEVLRPPLKSIEGLLAMPGFGRKMSERCVEIPWALGRLGGAKTMLEVGYANAERPYVDLLVSLRIPELHGLDLVKGQHREFIPTLGDVRDPPFPEGKFDFITCISTIEHVSRDNSGYGTADAPANDDGDFKAMKGLFRILKPGGRLIVTVPYGAKKDFGWFIQYDAERWDKLLAAAPFEKLAVEYFGYDDVSGWSRQGREKLAERIYGVNAPGASALACVELRKPLAP